jgi:two-component system sensor histidine kinase KdpD
VVHRTELEAEAERLKSSLLSAVSHDLKTPVAAIIAAGTTLLEHKKVLDTAGERALLSSIVSEGERLTRLIQNLLSVIRLDSPTVELNRTPESVEEIVAATVDRFAGLLDASHVTVDLEPDLPLVSAEPLLLQQVLINLLENAARYAGSGAHLWIHAAAIEDVVAVRVSDDGPGIPVDEREKVFEKFYRGRFSGKRDGGVGLGLTICRAIVRAHGGRIHVREREGGGTLVEFTVPLAPLPERPSSEATLLLS